MPSDGGLPPKMGEGETCPGGAARGWVRQRVWKGSVGVPTPGKATWRPRGLLLSYSGGVRGTGSSVAGVPSKSARAGVLQAEAGAALWHVFPPRHPLIASHGHPAGRSIGANATSLLQPIVPAFRSGERAIARWGAPCPGSGGKSRALARGWGFGAALQRLCLVWFQHSLFNSNDWQRLGRKALFVKG